MRRLFCYCICLFLIISLSAQSFEERYRQFRQQAKQDYTDFRSAANQRYADFLRSAWEYYRLAPAIHRPKEEQVPPVVYDEQNQRDNGQKRDDNNIPYEDIIPRPNPTPQPQPVSPVIQRNEHKTVLRVDFFGTSLSFRYPETAFSLPSIQGDNLAEAWELLATEQYDNLLYDCLSARDRAFFPAESLYYPYCDCEDRSILFAHLVRDLLGLEVVLLYYPGHLASAVCLNQPVHGDFLTVCGKRYVVCDPTYIGAPVGATMPGMDNKAAKVIMLSKTIRPPAAVGSACSLIPHTEPDLLSTLLRDGRCLWDGLVAGAAGAGCAPCGLSWRRRRRRPNGTCPCPQPANN